MEILSCRVRDFWKISENPNLAETDTFKQIKRPLNNKRQFVKILNYTINREEAIFWIICGVAVSAFILFTILAATNTNYDSSGIINACINISSFFLAAIFAIYTILSTCDKTIPGEFLYAIIFPVTAIITGLFALICSQFAATEKVVIPLIGISLMFTIITLAFLFFLIEILIRLNNRSKLKNQSSSINLTEATKNESA